MQAQKIVLMPLGADGTSGGDVSLLRKSEPYADFFRDVLRHFPFERENVAKFTLVSLGPKVTIGRGLN